MGDTERAVGGLRIDHRDQSADVEALVGAGEALTRLDRRQEAGDVLSRAEAAAPDKRPVLAAQGRLHAAAGHTDLALAYYQRALTIDPAAAAARKELQAIQRERAHRIELGYFFEHFNIEDTPDPQAGFGSVNFGRTRTSVSGNGAARAEVLAERDPGRRGRRVAGRDRRFRVRGGCAPRRGRRRCCRRATVTAGSTTGRGARPGASICAFAEFEDADVQIGGAGLEVRPSQSDMTPG